MAELVLSLFPGIGLLDRAFEEAGFVVVRGPDLLWGGDVRGFHPPDGRFDGVIGGPPCQPFSRLRHLVAANGFQVAEDLIPEFVRCVDEAAPRWFLMENAPQSPVPVVAGYGIWSGIFSNREFGEGVGAEQSRRRRFTFGMRGTAVDLSRYLELAPLVSPLWAPAVCASGGVKPGQPRDRRVRARHLGWKTAEALRESIRLQGLPEGFLDHAPFTLEGKHRVVGNGVPLPLGRAVAQAVRGALRHTREADRG